MRPWGVSARSGYLVEMIGKRKRDEGETRKGSVSPRLDNLPLESQELTNYHVAQLQESNRKHRQRVEELEERLAKVIGAFEDIQEGTGEEDRLSRKLEYMIEQKNDEILSLRNENHRLSMQNVFKASYLSGSLRSGASPTTPSGGRQSGRRGASASETIEDESEDSGVIDIVVSDLRSKVVEKDKRISELVMKREEISRENSELRRNLAVHAPCKSLESKLGDGEMQEIKLCRCVENVVGEIFELRSQLDAERLKFASLLENELFKGVKEFLANQRSCEEHTMTAIKELEEVRDRCNTLKQDLVSLESTQREFDIRDREQKKRIRELELANSKMESERARVSEFIRSVGMKLEVGDKEGIIESLMGEYEELSNAFEEKSLECDGILKSLREKEKELEECRTGIDEVKQALKEVETAKILYEEKISLIRKTTKNEVSREPLDKDSRISEFLSKHMSFIGQSGAKSCQQLEDGLNKSLIEHKLVSEKLALDLEFYKSECSGMREKLRSIEENEAAYSETNSILKSRVQYILNKVHKLTNLEINFDSAEENEDLRIDDYDHEFNKLKSENQELLALMKCSVCRDKVKDTVINRCGHLFCKECIDNNLSSRNRKCPLCHITFDKNDIGKIFLH